MAAGFRLTIALLECLRRGMIDLEDLQSVSEVLVPKGKRLGARTKHHILSHTAVDGLEQVSSVYRARARTGAGAAW
jgi:hypothetical protein